MVEVDARGLSCPEPIMLTAEALKNEKGPIKVLVSEPVQKENVEKYAKSQGKKPTSKEVGDDLGIRRIWKFRSSRENGCFFAYIYRKCLTYIDCRYTI